MRQVWIPRKGAPDVLEVRELPDPEPAPGQVRIEVAAAGVNFADLMARMGLYDDAPPLPCVVGYEVSGTIDAVGEGVDSALVGTDVIALTHFGGYSSMVCVDLRQAAVRPPSVDALTGATIPVTGLTAWLMIEVMGRVRAGDRVLVHSAGGGVGLAALDLCKRHGAFVAGTASPHKHATLRDRGLDLPLTYDQVDTPGALNDDPGFDLVLDPRGGASWRRGFELLRPGGRLAIYGLSASATGETGRLWDRVRTIATIPWFALGPVGVIQANKGVLGVNMGRLWDEQDRLRGWLDELLALVVAGEIRPQLHAAVPFAEAAEAHRILHRRENVGKVVLVP